MSQKSTSSFTIQNLLSFLFVSSIALFCSHLQATETDKTERLIKVNDIEKSTAFNRNKSRRKIGLALGGGGAKGSAHIGVLKVLEELNIPIDYIAGTSVGAYIGGLYATGLTATEIEQLFLSTDWKSGYSDKIKRSDLSYRNKKIRDKFQIDADLGFDGEKIKLPSGYIQGESMARLLRQSTKNLINVNDFDELPIPFRAVALNLGDMKPYIFKSGNLVTAMHASMAVPGVLKPVAYDGKLLADGGITNNLPIDVLNEMGANIIIAVDIGTQLSPESELDSYLSIIAQLVTHMTNTSSTIQKKKLNELDILIKPNVSDIGTGDFEKIKDGLPLGTAAAKELHHELIKFSLSKELYAEYVFEKAQKRDSLKLEKNLLVDKIKIVTNTRLDKNIIRNALRIKPGTTYSQSALEADIKRLYSQDVYERVDYEIEQQNGENTLIITVKEKSWGPGFLDMMLSIEESLDGDSDIALGAGYTLTDINRFGAEWRSEFIFGTRTDISTEFYTPFDNQQKYYWRSELGYTQHQRNFYINDTEKQLEFIQTEYTNFYTETELGWNINTQSIASLGYEGSRGNIDIIGFDGEVDIKSYGPYLQLGHDTLDNIFFPTRGQVFNLKYLRAHEKGANSKETSDAASFEWIGATSWSERHSIATHVVLGGTDSDLQLPTVVQDLGGYRNLSGFNRNQFSSRYKAFAALLYNYRMKNNDFGAFQFPVYLGLSLEKGNVWGRRKDVNFDDAITSGSISIGVDSNIGPVILAYGRASTGDHSLYLFVGTVF